VRAFVTQRKRRVVSSPARPSSYLCDDHATFAMAVGRSFYDQVLPPESVTLGWSSWGVQWLSRAPAPISDHVQVAYSRDENARLAYARQGADDWSTFLTARSREMRSGARLVVVTMALDDHREFGYRPLFTAMMAALSDLVDEGVLREDAQDGNPGPWVAAVRKPGGAV
jgi:hypothetical protein